VQGLGPSLLTAERLGTRPERAEVFLDSLAALKEAAAARRDRAALNSHSYSTSLSQLLTRLA